MRNDMNKRWLESAIRDADGLTKSILDEHSYEDGSIPEEPIIICDGYGPGGKIFMLTTENLSELVEASRLWLAVLSAPGPKTPTQDDVEALKIAIGYEPVPLSIRDHPEIRSEYRATADRDGLIERILAAGFRRPSSREPQGEPTAPVRVIYVAPDLIEEAQDALGAAGYASVVYTELARPAQGEPTPEAPEPNWQMCGAYPEEGVVHEAQEWSPCIKTAGHSGDHMTDKDYCAKTGYWPQSEPADARAALSKIRTAIDNSEDWYEFGNRVESILDEYYWRTEVSDD